MVRLAVVIVILTVSQVAAQEACVEPMQPDADYLADAGYEVEGMREFYRGYFSDVENYLNCLNRSAARIRQEATAAAWEYNRVLDHYPVQPGQEGDLPQAPLIGMSDSSTLFLDYQAEWLK